MKHKNPALAAYVTLVYFFLLGPLFIIAAAAFSGSSFLEFPPRSFSLKWFVNILEVSAFLETFLVSLKIALMGTFLSLIIGVPAAYALSRWAVPGRGVLQSIFVSPVIVPGVVLGFALLRFYNVQGGVPVFQTLLIGHTLIVLPYSIRVISSSLANFDPAIEEAAISLGCPRWRTFFVVVLPNIRAGVMAAFILAFITSMNNVPVSVFLTGPGVSTLPIQMLSYVENFFDPTIASLSVVLIGTTALFMFLIERTLGLSYFAR